MAKIKDKTLSTLRVVFIAVCTILVILLALLARRESVRKKAVRDINKNVVEIVVK